MINDRSIRQPEPDNVSTDTAGHVLAVQRPGKPRIVRPFDADTAGHVLAVARPGKPRIGKG